MKFFVFLILIHYKNERFNQYLLESCLCVNCWQFLSIVFVNFKVRAIASFLGLKQNFYIGFFIIVRHPELL